MGYRQIASGGSIPGFSDLLTSISTELHAPIAVEGFPDNYSAAAEKATKVFEKQQGWRRLEELASLLDYEVVRDRAGILLRKKYTSAQDVPCISFEELYDFYKDLLALSRNYSPPLWEPGEVPPTMRWKHDFIRSLSSTEWEQMKASGLPVSQMGQASTAILYKVLAGSYIGGHYSFLNELLLTLAAVRQATLEMRGETAVASWKTRFGAPVKAVFEYNSSNRRLPPQSSPEDLSIRRVEEIWNRKTGDRIRCDYTPGLHEKPVLIVPGDASLSASTIGALVSKLYELRMERRGGIYQVHPLRLPQRLARVEDFHAALTTAMPSPLRRSILVPEKPTATLGSVFQGTIPTKPWRDGAVCQGAQQFVIASLSSRLKNEKTKSIPFSAALPREKAAIAIWLSRGYLEWLAGSLYLEPPYISQFSKLRLVCAQYIGKKGRPMLSMQAQRWDERQGRWIMSIGWGDLWDITQK